jgi:hypothetical protein
LQVHVSGIRKRTNQQQIVQNAIYCTVLLNVKNLNVKDMNRQLLINNSFSGEIRMILGIRKLKIQDCRLKNQTSEVQFNAISGMSMQLTA